MGPAYGNTNESTQKQQTAGDSGEFTPETVGERGSESAPTDMVELALTPADRDNDPQMRSVIGQALNHAKSFLAALKSDDKVLALQIEPEMLAALQRVGKGADGGRSGFPLTDDACVSADQAMEEMRGAVSGVANLFFSIVDEDQRENGVTRQEAVNTWSDWNRDTFYGGAKDCHLYSLCEFIHDAERALKVGVIG